MDICRHFYPTQILNGCKVGRVAQLDCGTGCRVYNPEPEPLIRKHEDRELWSVAYDDEEPSE